MVKSMTAAKDFKKSFISQAASYICRHLCIIQTIIDNFDSKGASSHNNWCKDFKTPHIKHYCTLCDRKKILHPNTLLAINATHTCTQTHSLNKHCTCLVQTSKVHDPWLVIYSSSAVQWLTTVSWHMGKRKKFSETWTCEEISLNSSCTT